MREFRRKEWLRERHELSGAERARVDAQLRERKARAGARANDDVASFAARDIDVVRRGDDGAVNACGEGEAIVHERHVVPRCVADGQGLDDCDGHENAGSAGR